MLKTKNNHIRKIFFIGRLEKEKGIDIVLSCIKEALRRNIPLEFHIIGAGSYTPEVYKYSKYPCVFFYGMLSQKELQERLTQADFLLMPSRFLETFGLVALEAIGAGVPVIGFAKGGLREFIPPEYALDEGTPIESFFEILEKSAVALPDISLYGLEHWRRQLVELVGHCRNILIIHDYRESIGGAERFVAHFQTELQGLGKQTEVFSFSGNCSSHKKRLFLFLFSPLAFWRGWALKKKIRTSQPDMIISHTLLRYVSFWGMRAIQQSKLPHMMMHHDTGLVTPYPSQLEHEGDIPPFSCVAWCAGKHLLSSFFICWKYFCVSQMIQYIPKNTRHLVPSAWMKPYFSHLPGTEVRVFPHALFPQESEKK